MAFSRTSERTNQRDRQRKADATISSLRRAFLEALLVASWLQIGQTCASIARYSLASLM